MVNVTMEDICYQSLFFFLNRVGIPVERITTLCREGDTVCLQSLENMLVEPLIKVQALPNTP
jgi:hypothetical protein